MADVPKVRFEPVASLTAFNPLGAKHTSIRWQRRDGTAAA